MFGEILKTNIQSHSGSFNIFPIYFHHTFAYIQKHRFVKKGLTVRPLFNSFQGILHKMSYFGEFLLTLRGIVSDLKLLQYPKTIGKGGMTYKGTREFNHI